MSAFFRRLWIAVLCILALSAITAHAQQVAEDITDDTRFLGSGYIDFSFLKDGDIDSYKSSNSDVTLKLENSQGIGAVYLMFDEPYGEYTVTDNDSGTSITAGAYEFLHEYIDLAAAFKKAPTSVTIAFDSGSVSLSEVYAFSQGDAPDFVQIWQPPLDGRADMVIFSTHGDDEHLFFGGIMPLYADARGYDVQVVYMTDHRNLTMERTHEMLNGLWAVGMRVYPVFGDFPDFLIKNMEKTYQRYEKMGYSRESIVEYVVENIRRFRPQVIIGHDLDGEYAHGMHMVYADALVKALELSNDATKFPDSADKYGTWDVPKTYLHLYGENKILMDYDTPMEELGGLTPFLVSQTKGYACHLSQHDTTMFTDWVFGVNRDITKASEIAEWNPQEFGLYRTTVGADIEKNDFMENIVSYAEQARIEAQRIEEEKRQQEEAARREEERRQEEERKKQEEERKKQEEEARIQAQIAAEKAKQQALKDAALRQQRILVVACCTAIALIIIATTLFAIKRLCKGRKS